MRAIQNTRMTMPWRVTAVSVHEAGTRTSIRGFSLSIVEILRSHRHNDPGTLVSLPGTVAQGPKWRSSADAEAARLHPGLGRIEAIGGRDFKPIPGDVSAET